MEQLTYALDRAEPAELAFQILFISLIAQTRDDQRLERIATNVGVRMRVV
jgi:hypothetical protein